MEPSVLIVDGVYYVPTTEAVPQGTTNDNTEPELISPNVPPLARRLLQDRNDFNVDHETQLKRWMHAHKVRIMGPHRASFDQLLESFGYRHPSLSTDQKRALRNITKDRMGTCFRQMQRKGAAWEVPNPLRPIQRLVRYADWCVTWNDPNWDGRVEKPAGWDGNGGRRVGGNENVERPAAGWVVIVKIAGWENSPEDSVANEDESQDEHASERNDIDIEDTQERRDRARAVGDAQKSLQSAEEALRKAAQTVIDNAENKAARERALVDQKKALLDIQAAEKALETAKKAMGKQEQENYATIQITRPRFRRFGNDDTRSTPPKIERIDLSVDVIMSKN